MSKANLVAFLIIACICHLSHGSRLGAPKRDSDQVAKRRKLVIIKDEVLQFKSTFNQEDSEILDVEFSSSSNAFSVHGKSYSLHNVQQYSVLTPDFRIFVDGDEVPHDAESPVYAGNDGQHEIFVSRDIHRRIDVIEVFDGENVTTLESDLTEDEIEEEMPSIQVNEQFDYSNVTYDLDDRDQLEDAVPTNIFTTMGACSRLRTIDVAIGFDSTFCSWLGGVNKAVSRIQYIVAMASKKYKQGGLCLKLRLSAADARCAFKKDVYKNMRRQSGCAGGKGFLHDVTKYWHDNMRSVPRDAAHVFIARKMDGPVGCAGIGMLCKGAYGVEQINYFPDMKRQAMLFAHELGHNCGATHLNGDGYIMNPQVSDGRNGFAPQSVYKMAGYLNKVKCLA